MPKAHSASSRHPVRANSSLSPYNHLPIGQSYTVVEGRGEGIASTKGSHHRRYTHTRFSDFDAILSKPDHGLMRRFLIFLYTNGILLGDFSDCNRLPHIVELGNPR